MKQQNSNSDCAMKFFSFLCNNKKERAAYWFPKPVTPIQHGAATIAISSLRQVSLHSHTIRTALCIEGKPS